MTDSDRLSFLTKIYPHAKRVESETGFNSVAMMAQACGECGWEEPPGNMYFGVKSFKETDNRQLIRTKEILDRPDVKFPVIHSITPIGNKFKYDIEDWFMKYDSPYESFRDHARFVTENKRYSKALEVKDNPVLFLTELAKAGYATGENYAQFMTDMVKSVEIRLKKLSLT